MDQSLGIQVGEHHYDFTCYENPARYQLYYHITRAVLDCRPKSVLEVGSGNGIVSAGLSAAGVPVTRIDLDSNLKPDLRGDVTRLPFVENAFDLVLASQVLEHIPVDMLSSTLAGLARVACRRVVLSVPYNQHYFSLGMQVKINKYLYLGGRVNRWLEKWGEQRFYLGRSQTKRTFEFDGEHHWELGYRQYPMHWFLDLVAPHFEVVESFRVPNSPYHYAFVLKTRREDATG